MAARASSSALEKTEPPGQVLASSPNGRRTRATPSLPTLWSSANGYVSAIKGRSVLRRIPSGSNTYFAITSA